MKRILVVALLLAINASFVIAHHPAVDMVDAEIYAMIDDLVSDTPHAELVFDAEMGDGGEITVITTDSVSVADDLIDDGLLVDVSLLDGEGTIRIEFLEEEESLLLSVAELNQRPVTKSNPFKRQTKITIYHKYDL